MLIYELKFVSNKYMTFGKYHYIDHEERTAHINADSIEDAMEIMSRRYYCPVFSSVKLLCSVVTEERYDY